VAEITATPFGPSRKFEKGALQLTPRNKAGRLQQWTFLVTYWCALVLLAVLRDPFTGDVNSPVVLGTSGSYVNHPNYIPKLKMGQEKTERRYEIVLAPRSKGAIYVQRVQKTHQPDVAITTVESNLRFKRSSP